MSVHAFIALITACRYHQRFDTCANDTFVMLHTASKYAMSYACYCKRGTIFHAYLFNSENLKSVCPTFFFLLLLNSTQLYLRQHYEVTFGNEQLNCTAHLHLSCPVKQLVNNWCRNALHSVCAPLSSTSILCNSASSLSLSVLPSSHPGPVYSSRPSSRHHLHPVHEIHSAKKMIQNQ